MVKTLVDKLKTGGKALAFSSFLTLCSCISYTTAVPVREGRPPVLITQTIPFPTDASENVGYPSCQPSKIFGDTTIHYSNGMVYRGDVKEGIPHGQGIMTLGSLEYRGGFAGGLKEGYGEEVRKDGTTLKGFRHKEKWVGETKEDYERALKADNEVANTKQG